MCRQTHGVGKHSNPWKYNCPLLPYPLTGPFSTPVDQLKSSALYNTFVLLVLFSQWFLLRTSWPKMKKRSSSEGPHLPFVEDNWNQLTGRPNSDPALSLFHALIWLLCGPAKHLASLANMNNGGRNGWQGETDNGTIPQCERSFLFNSQALLTFMELLPQQLPCSKILLLRDNKSEIVLNLPSLGKFKKIKLLMVLAHAAPAETGS